MGGLGYGEVQNESPQDVPLWEAVCFELKATSAPDSRETSEGLGLGGLTQNRRLFKITPSDFSLRWGKFYLANTALLILQGPSEAPRALALTLGRDVLCTHFPSPS